MVIDSVTLHDVSEVFHYSKDSVTLLKFSGDSRYMATAVRRGREGEGRGRGREGEGGEGGRGREGENGAVMYTCTLYKVNV